MVQLGQARVALARELMKNSRASHTPGPTGRQANRQTGMLTVRSMVNPTPIDVEWMRHEGKLKYVEKLWHSGKLNECILQTDDMKRSLKMCFCASWVWKWGRVSQTQISQHPSLVRRTIYKVYACTHQQTHTYPGSQMRFCLCCSQARREGEVELSDAAIRTTLSGRANKNEYFSLEISTGTYDGGLAHLQA